MESQSSGKQTDGKKIIFSYQLMEKMKSDGKFWSQNFPKMFSKILQNWEKIPSLGQKNSTNF